MHGRGVFENLKCGEVAWCTEAGGFQPVDAHLLAGGHRLGRRQPFEVGVQPCPGDQPGGRRRPDLFGELGEQPVLLRGENAFLDTYPRSAISSTSKSVISSTIGLTVRPIVIVIVIMLCHGAPFVRRLICGRGQPAACSQCSGISVLNVSAAVPV